MHYEYNRKAFRSIRGVAGVEPLAIVYCSCVLMELSLKQHLGVVTTGSNGGHDLPQLIQRVGLKDHRHAVTCNALKTQLVGLLGQFPSQGKLGKVQQVPAVCYPYLRYVRHSSDWVSDCCSDVEINALRCLIERIIHFLQHNVGASI